MPTDTPQDTLTRPEPANDVPTDFNGDDPSNTLADESAPAPETPAEPAERPGTAEPASPTEEAKADAPAPKPQEDPAESTAPAATSEEPSPTETPAEDPDIPTESEPELSHEAMEQLIDEYVGEGAPETGEIKPATVINVTSDGIVVDLGLKQEGIVPRAEFTNEKGDVTTKPGDKFDVLVEASHAAEGYIPCSADGAYRLRLWECVESASVGKEKVKIRVTGRVKGGFEVDILFPVKVPGHRPLSGFIPGSQMDIRPVRNWDGFLKRELYAHILRFNRRRGNIVLSRRDLLEEEQASRKKLLDEVLMPDAVLKGTVKNMTDYGAFVDIGGIDGLLHITDISHRRLTHPSEVLRNGQEITVKVLKVDKKKERVSLGMKQNEADPWAAVPAKYKVGQRVKGRVTHMLDFGAFVEIEPGIEGLIHVSEMSWTKKVRRPSDVLNEGDSVEAAVLDINARDKRLSLGLRQTEPDPFHAVAERFPVGSVIDGKVTSLTDFGAFVEVEPGVEGMIHASELTWDKKAKKPKSVLKKGEEIKAKVIKVDVLNRRLGLSRKDLTPDPVATFMRQHKTGDVVKARATRKTDFGVFAEVGEGVEGLCHISELPEDRDEIKIGEEYEFKIVKLKPADKRISLSIRAMERVHQKRAMKDFKSSQPSARTTLGDFMKAQGLTGTRKRKEEEKTDETPAAVEAAKETAETPAAPEAVETPATPEPVAEAAMETSHAPEAAAEASADTPSHPAPETASTETEEAPAVEPAEAVTKAPVEETEPIETAPVSAATEAASSEPEAEAEPKPEAKSKAKKKVTKKKTAKAAAKKKPAKASSSSSK